MSKITINLLPPEAITEELKKAKFYKVQAVGIATILTLAFLTSLTVALRVLQSRNITEVQAQVSQTQQRVSELKGTQASLVLLQNRLAVIGEVYGTSSKQTAIYKLIDKLLPSSAVINSITIDKTGEVVFSALVPNVVSLDQLISNLSNKDSNDSKINQVAIESLNRSKDGVYRVSIKIKPAS